LNMPGPPLPFAKITRGALYRFGARWASRLQDFSWLDARSRGWDHRKAMKSTLFRFFEASRSSLLLAAGCILSAGSALPLDEVLWEKNRGWASSGWTYFDGSVCAPGEEGTCPQEMGWQGNSITWSFTLPADAAKTQDLRFEISVLKAFEPLEISIFAGPSGGLLAAAGSIQVSVPQVHRIVMPSALFQPGARNLIRMEGDNPVGYGEPSGIRWVSVGLYRHYVAPPSVTDEELLDDTERRACRYFYEQVFPNGLVLDAVGSRVASIAAVGFGATAMTIVADRTGSSPLWSLPGISAPTAVAAAARARVV
jgi:hypothetical protein